MRRSDRRIVPLCASKSIKPDLALAPDALRSTKFDRLREQAEASSERGVDVATTQPLCAVLSGSLARRLNVAQFKIGDLRGVQVESL